MEVSLLDIKAYLLIWMLTCLGLVSSQELHLSSSPTRLLPGQSVTLSCKADFNIRCDPIYWNNSQASVVYTQSSDQHIILPDKLGLEGRWNVSIDKHHHNITITTNTRDDWGPWTCKSTVKTISSNELHVTLSELINSTSGHTVDVTSGHTLDVTSGHTVNVTSGHTINVASGHNVKKSNEAIYIAVGSSVGVAILIAVIAITVCCILKRKRRNEDDERVMEENVLYMSSSLDDTEGPFPSDGQVYATINKPKQAGSEGVNLDELYAKPNKPKKTDINGVNPDELYAKPNKPMQTGNEGVNVDDLYAKPNKKGKKEP